MAEDHVHQAFSLLSDKAILRHIEKGTVVIEPFRRENLSTSSYDVTLGPYFFKEAEPEAGQGVVHTNALTSLDFAHILKLYFLQVFTIHTANT